MLDRKLIDQLFKLYLEQSHRVSKATKIEVTPLNREEFDAMVVGFCPQEREEFALSLLQGTEGYNVFAKAIASRSDRMP